MGKMSYQERLLSCYQSVVQVEKLIQYNMYKGEYVYLRLFEPDDYEKTYYWHNDYDLMNTTCGMFRFVSKEIASRNILVNAVAPGFIETNMTDVLKDEVKEAISKQIPLNRMGKAEDVANVVKFLASEDSSYITEQVK